MGIMKRTAMKLKQVFVGVAIMLAMVTADAVAALPSPVVEWDGDFDISTKDNCTITVGTGNSVAADGSTITIGSSEGVRVSWGTPTRSSYTVIVRYRDMVVPTSASGAVLAGHAGGSSSGFMMTAAGMVQGIYAGKAYKDPLSAYPIDEGGSGCYAMAFSTTVMEQSGTNGQLLYVKTSGGEWQHHSTNAGAVYTARDNLAGCVVAGPCPDAQYYAYVPSTMDGLKIEAISVFPGALTLAQVSEYWFPSETYSVEISDAGSFAWADLPWVNGKVPVGDVCSNAVELVCNADVTITDSALAVTAAVMRISGSGRLTFAGAAEFGVKKDVSAIEMDLAMSGDGALTLAEGEWHLGRQVAGYKNFTISGSNPLTLGTNATLVIYDGKIGSPVAGWGTIRSVDVLPRASQLDVALQNQELWHGNCVLEEIDNVDFVRFYPDNYGNETSKLTFNGVTNKYFTHAWPIPTEADTLAFKPEFVVKNHANAGGVGLGVRAGATGAIAKIKKLSGDGTIVNHADGSAANHMLLIQDWESFTGGIQLYSRMRVCFGTTATGSGVSDSGVVIVRSGAPLSLDAYSKIHGFLENDAGYTVVEGTLSVVSGKALCGGRVSLRASGELVFDADKAQTVSDATLTDCSAEDMSKISGTGLIRFKGTYAPFILPNSAARNLNATMTIRIDGATVNGDLSVGSRFGGNGTFRGGTLSFQNGATLDLTWGMLTLAADADLAAPPETFTVVYDNLSAKGEVKLLSASTVPASWQNQNVTVVSQDGSKVRHFRTLVRADGLYAVPNGFAIVFR